LAICFICARECRRAFPLYGRRAERLTISTAKEWCRFGMFMVCASTFSAVQPRTCTKISEGLRSRADAGEFRQFPPVSDGNSLFETKILDPDPYFARSDSLLHFRHIYTMAAFVSV
jgi:hypothetical protein